MDNKSRNIDKPLIIAKEELCQKITQAMNESGIPLFIIEYILKDILNDIHNINQQILENEKMNYEKNKNNTIDT